MKRAKNTSLASYEAQSIVMEAALDNDRMQYTLPSASQAKNFVAQCNRLRVLLRDQDAALHQHDPAHTPASRYDKLVIRVIDGVVVQFDHNILRHTVTDANGNELDLTKYIRAAAVTQSDNPLEAFLDEDDRSAPTIPDDKSVFGNHGETDES